MVEMITHGVVHVSSTLRNWVVYGFGGLSAALFGVAALAIVLLAARSRGDRTTEADDVESELASGAALPAARVQPRTRVASAAEVLAAKLREYELAGEHERQRKATEARRGGKHVEIPVERDAAWRALRCVRTVWLCCCARVCVCEA